MSDEPLRLNLGAGGVEIDGFIPVDRKNGKEVYPLEYEDGTVDEIYASHVLEHFSHRETEHVLRHWVQKLRPGGRLRVAVPDFGWIAEHYVAGEPINTAGYIMGGHVDKDDVHGAVFDGEYLREIMARTGLERIGKFESEYNDCSSLAVSLNLEGFKPSTDDVAPRDTCGILSAPRFGPVLHFRHAVIAFGAHKIPYQIGQGAYWHQVLSEQMEDALSQGMKYIITADYDSVFSAHDVIELYRLMVRFPDVDAICAVQMKRGRDFALFGLLDDDGKPKVRAYSVEFDRMLTPVSVGHFGLTIFRAESLDKFSRPWMEPTPNADGRWGKDHGDADITFWQKFKKEGFQLCLANRIAIGHMDETIKWPDKNLGAVYQDASDYHANGKPANAWR